MDYQKNAKYFIKPSLKWPIIICVVGLFLIAAKGVGLLFIALGIFLIVRQYIGRSTDVQIDESLSSSLGDIRQTAQERLMLDDEQINLVDPLQVSGYLYEGSMTKKGKDGQVRASRGEGMVIFFDENILYIYNTQFSIVKPEQTVDLGQHAYRDIQNINSHSSMTVIGKENVNMETLTIELANGKSAWIRLPQSPEVMRSMNGVIQLYRQKKSQQL